jgi:hypothetical protein
MSPPCSIQATLCITGEFICFGAFGYCATCNKCNRIAQLAGEQYTFIKRVNWPGTLYETNDLIKKYISPGQIHFHVTVQSQSHGLSRSLLPRFDYDVVFFQPSCLAQCGEARVTGKKLPIKQ